MDDFRPIEIKEHQTISLPKESITSEIEYLLSTKFNNQLSVEAPWIKTDNQWRITSRGWVGFYSG